jgi:disease resistance protein RPS2
MVGDHIMSATLEIQQ